MLCNYNVRFEILIMHYDRFIGRAVNVSDYNHEVAGSIAGSSTI